MARQHFRLAAQNSPRGSSLYASDRCSSLSPRYGYRCDPLTCNTFTNGLWSVCVIGYVKLPGGGDGCFACEYGYGCSICYYAKNGSIYAGDGTTFISGNNTVLQGAYVDTGVCIATRTWTLHLERSPAYVLLYEDSLTRVYGCVSFTADPVLNPVGHCTTAGGSRACNSTGFIPDGRDSTSGGGPQHGINGGVCPNLIVDTSSTFSIGC